MIGTRRVKHRSVRLARSSTPSSPWRVRSRAQVKICSNFKSRGVKPPLWGSRDADDDYWRPGLKSANDADLKVFCLQKNNSMQGRMCSMEETPTLRATVEWKWSRQVPYSKIASTPLKTSFAILRDHRPRYPRAFRLLRAVRLRQRVAWLL